MHNTIWNNVIKCILFTFPKFCYKIQKYVEKTMCCIGFGTSHDVLQELLEVEQCWQRLEDKETNSHELSTWRLRTPTICRRSVPALCNAGLPKKKTLQQGNIDKKTNQIVLASTMPLLEYPLLLLTEGLSITSEVFTWMPFRGTHIKVWWASICMSPKYSAQ